MKPSDRSVEAEFAVDGAHFRRPDEARVGDRHRVQRAFQRSLPEEEKLLQQRERRAQIVILPDVALQQPGMVGTPIEDMRGGQAVAVELLLEIRRSAVVEVFRRSAVVEVFHGALQPGGLQFAVHARFISSPNRELSVYDQGIGSIARDLLPTGPMAAIEHRANTLSRWTVPDQISLSIWNLSKKALFFCLLAINDVEC